MMIFCCRPFDFTLGKSGEESNAGNSVPLADRAGTEIVIPARFFYQEPKQGEKFRTPIVLRHRIGLLGLRFSGVVLMVWTALVKH